jgi:DedD protein
LTTLLNARLKERLIGAAVLVALGVWLIPWVLDGPAPMPESASLELPAAENSAPLRSQTIPLDAKHGATAAGADGDVGEARRTDSARPESASIENAGSDGSRSPSTPESEPNTRTAAALAPSSAETVDPEPTAGTDLAAAGLWVVQLGSFGEADNARRLADRVSHYGYQAEVSAFRAGGRAMHRVRIGPQASRTEAEVIASALSAHGFVAQVVTRD